jgi:hypothetical protein
MIYDTIALLSDIKAGSDKKATPDEVFDVMVDLKNRGLIHFDYEIVRRGENTYSNAEMSALKFFVQDVLEQNKGLDKVNEDVVADAVLRVAWAEEGYIAPEDQLSPNSSSSSSSFSSSSSSACSFSSSSSSSSSSSLSSCSSSCSSSLSSSSCSSSLSSSSQSSSSSSSQSVESGKLYTFGYNTYGQLGDGTKTNNNTPTQVGSDTDWNFVNGGMENSFAIKAGKLYTWGYNDYGQLGIGNTTQVSTPTQVGSDTTWTCVHGNYTTVAIKEGKLFVCGSNAAGQFCDTTTNNSSTFKQLGSATDWTQAICGSGNIYAINSSGQLFACGANGSGQLGDGSKINRTTNLVQIGSETTWTSVCAIFGDSASTFGISDGKLYRWGDPVYNDGSGATQVTSPTQIGVVANWKKVVCGDMTMLAITTDGKLYSWGGNWIGEAGSGAKPTWPLYRVGTDADNWTDIGCSYYSSAAINSGKLYTSGCPTGSGAAIAQQYAAFTQIGSDTNWFNLGTSGNGHIMALKH